jgi:hypothetical protein
MVNAGVRARPRGNLEAPRISGNLSHSRAAGATEIGVK